MPLDLSFMIILCVLGVVASLVVTIVLCLTVVPDKKRNSLKGFGRFLNDLFNFRGLLIESIIKFFYVLITVTFVVGGFFLLFAVDKGENIYTGETTTVWYGWIGLIAMIIGPIITRLVFESAMLFILLVKNTIQINNKLKDQYRDGEVVAKDKKNRKVAPAAQVSAVSANLPSNDATSSDKQE